MICIFYSAYGDLQYDEISLNFTAGYMSLCGVTSHLWSVLLLFAFQSMFISIWVFRLEIAEFPDSVRRSAP